MNKNKLCARANMKKIIIDNRMRKPEKEFFKNLGYELIELPKSSGVYPEISSHVDIFLCKIGDTVVAEKSQFEHIKDNSNTEIFAGDAFVGSRYPEDVKYNVCQIGKCAVHNFKYTDRKILEEIDKQDLQKIQISQGYSNCSIAVIDENSVIVTDSKIAEILSKVGIEALCLDYLPDIKLLDENGNFSKMTGFIGGAIARVENKIIIFGDLNKIDKNDQIKNFIKERNLGIVDFAGLDVIDYGGVLVL